MVPVTYHQPRPDISKKVNGQARRLRCSWRRIYLHPNETTVPENTTAFLIITDTLVDRSRIRRQCFLCHCNSERRNYINVKIEGQNCLLDKQQVLTKFGKAWSGWIQS